MKRRSLSFGKDFILTPHTIDQQLAALKELLDKRDADMAQENVVTNPAPLDECTAFDDDDLDEIRKIERKRP
jgi:hypothetical protein